jgi:hypothetical protein
MHVVMLNPAINPAKCNRQIMKIESPPIAAGKSKIMQAENSKGLQSR